MSTIDMALKVAIDAHAGQTDKVGQPYILHILRVMARMQTEAEMIVAILHDVVEDSDMTLDTLREIGFSEAIVLAITAITKQDGDIYENYLQRVKTNPLARRVKLADLEDNMDFKRGLVPSEAYYVRQEKYHKAWHFLHDNG